MHANLVCRCAITYWFQRFDQHLIDLEQFKFCQPAVCTNSIDQLGLIRPVVCLYDYLFLDKCIMTNLCYNRKSYRRRIEHIHSMLRHFLSVLSHYFVICVKKAERIQAGFGLGADAI